MRDDSQNANQCSASAVTFVPGYDSDPLRERLKKQHIDLIVPYRNSNKERLYEDRRKLRRYVRRYNPTLGNLSGRTPSRAL